MASTIELTVSGAAIASAKVPDSANQVVAIVATPDGTVALNVSVYLCPTLPSGSIPSGSQIIGKFSAPAAGNSQIISLSPDGIGVASGYFAAQFTDAGTAHAVFLYVK